MDKKEIEINNLKYQRAIVRTVSATMLVCAVMFLLIVDVRLRLSPYNDEYKFAIWNMVMSTSNYVIIIGVLINLLREAFERFSK